MDALFTSLANLATSVGSTILLAILVFIIGRIVIGAILKFLTNSKLLGHVDGAVRTFTISFARISLYLLLAISIIGILGVPMASIVAALASAGVAIGLALQGAL